MSDGFPEDATLPELLERVTPLTGVEHLDFFTKLVEATGPPPTAGATVVLTPSGGNDTVAINNAITLLSAAGGGVVQLAPGLYTATQIILKRSVLLDGGTVAAVCLTQIGGTNADFIISENFAVLTGTANYATADARVPYWFGLKDIRINGNRGPNTSGRGIAWFGSGQMMKGVVIVEHCAGDNIYTENSGVAWDPSLGFAAQEEAVFETVISRLAGRYGWLFRGPHNARIHNYYCLQRDGGDYGWVSESTATASGVTDYIDFIRVYSQGTNRKGMYFGAAFAAGFLSADATSLVIAAQATVGMVWATPLTTDSLMVVSGNLVQIGQLYLAVLGVGGFAALTWSGDRGAVASAFIFDNIGVAATTGVLVTGQLNLFAKLHLASFAGPGSIGLKNTGFSNRFATCLFENNKLAIDHSGTGTTGLEAEVITNAGQLAIGGTATPSVVDRFWIHETGVRAAGTDQRVTTVNAIAMDSTALQTITLAHACVYTPLPRNVSLSFYTPTVTDFVWAIPPYLVGADAVNLTIKCKLSTASATAGSKGDVIAHIRMGA